MKCLILCLAGSSLLLPSACGDSEISVEQSTPTPSVAATVSATPEPTLDAKAFEPYLEARFQAFESRISDQLVRDGGSATCLSELLAELALIREGETPCARADMDGDGQDDYAVRLFLPDLPDYRPGTVVIFGAASSYTPVFRVRNAFEGEPLDASYSWLPAPSIFGAEDFNGDGKIELAATSHQCGAHTCFTRLFVLGFSDGRNELLVRKTAEAPFGVVEAPDADNQIRFEDADGDGSRDLVFRQGVIKSLGTGWQRASTETYLWDGEKYTFSGRVYDPSDHRYFKVRDADDAFARSAYQTAIDLYQTAMNDRELKDVEYFGSTEELIAYSGFRIALAYIQLGDILSASSAVEGTIAGHPDSLYGQATVEFRNAAGFTQAGIGGSLTDGCAAVTTFLTKNLERFHEVWNYGYANAVSGPEAICPF
jgi:hypothetical protein